MEEFEALITSLGEHLVDYIGREHLQRLDVYGDEADGSAHIEVFLTENTWIQQSAVIDKMIELRAMFMDELAIDYRFAEVDSATASAASARHTAFSLA